MLSVPHFAACHTGAIPRALYLKITFGLSALDVTYRMAAPPVPQSSGESCRSPLRFARQAFFYSFLSGVHMPGTSFECNPSLTSKPYPVHRATELLP